MKTAAFLPLLALLAGCGAEQAGQQPADAPFERHWPGALAVLDEYRIQAVFPYDTPVCVADSGTHIHGFYQWRSGDCADESRPSGRFVSIWADYNAAFLDWDQAAARRCGTDTEPFDVGVHSTGPGRLSACKPKLCGEQYVIIVSYLADLPALELGAAAPGGGPDLIYTISLGTTPGSEADDLATLRAFLAQIELAGDRFRSA